MEKGEKGGREEGKEGRSDTERAIEKEGNFKSKKYNWYIQKQRF